MLIIANTTVYTPERRRERSSIVIQNGQISDYPARRSGGDPKRGAHD